LSRILLAEDDTTMRVFLTKALQRAGHDVFAVGDGLEALAASKTVQFDLLVADVVMPSLDGFQLAARARAAHPELKVMFITGFAAVSLRGRDAEFVGAKVLSKPFHLRELVEGVHEVLSSMASAL
jgi:two-component system cell cycle response regulator CpdR